MFQCQHIGDPDVERVGRVTAAQGELRRVGGGARRQPAVADTQQQEQGDRPEEQPGDGGDLMVERRPAASLRRRMGPHRIIAVSQVGT